MRGIRAVCALSVVALAGCSSPAEPETLDSLPSTTAEYVPSQQPTPSQPVESPSTSPNEAINFVNAYVDLTNLALAEPRAMAEWQELFAPSCSVCASSFETAEGIHNQGNTISGGAWSDWVVTLADQQDNEALVIVSGSIGEATVSSAAGEAVDTFEAIDSVSVAYALRRQPDGNWLIVAGDVVQ